MKGYVALAVPAFFLFIALEWLVARRKGHKVYRLNDALSNIGTGVLQQITGVWGFLLLGGVYVLIFEKVAPFQWSIASPLAWVAALLLEDLRYYLWHRAGHRVGFMWLGHVVHHQSEEYNLSVALRQAFFGNFTSWPFFFVLALMGVPPLMAFTCSSINTLYQFWLHSRLIPKLGVLEKVLNTPSHHRVHHGVNPQYIDKNYAGMLIIWDRLFGTFIEEDEEPVYGTVKPLQSWNPVWANWAYLHEMLGTARKTPKLWDKVKVFAMPPGWQPGLGEAPIPHPGKREPWNTTASRATDLYVAFNFAAVFAVSYLLLLQEFPYYPRDAVIVWVALSLGSLAALHMGKTWAVKTETARWLLTAGALLSLFWKNS